MPKTRAEIGVFFIFFGTPQVRGYGAGIFSKGAHLFFIFSCPNELQFSGTFEIKLIAYTDNCW